MDSITDSSGEKGKTTPPVSSKDVEGVVHGHTTSEVILSKHGIRLHPQPVVSDPLDPLNWSAWRKNTILAIVMSLYVPNHRVLLAKVHN